MTTRSGRKKNTTLIERITEEPNLSVNMTRTRSKKMAENHENKDVGKFVKYREETPVKDQQINRRKKIPLKEHNIDEEEIKKPAQISDELPKGRGRHRRNNKNKSEIDDEVCSSEEMNSKITQKAIATKKSINITMNDDNKEKSPVELSKKKSKKKGRSKKIKASSTPDFKQIVEVPADSVDASKQKESNASFNTSVESYHSARDSTKTEDALDGTVGRGSVTNKLLNNSNVSKGAQNSTFTPEGKMNNTITVEETGNNCIPSCDNRHDKNTEQQVLLNSTFDKFDIRSPRRSSEKYRKQSVDLFSTSAVLIDSSVDSSKSTNITDPNLTQDSIVFNNEKRRTLNETFEKEEKVTLPKLIREGTFTKEPKISYVDKGSPIRTKRFVAAPGSTPYNSRRQKTRSAGKSSSIMNLTYSNEKDKLKHCSTTVEELRPTKVMFCSPVCNISKDTERKSKIIKSSLKGSNKSFVYDDASPTKPMLPSSRKRSFTLNDMDNVASKRSKLTGAALTNSVNRLTRAKTIINGKQPEGEASTPSTPHNRPPLRKSLSETGPSSVRSKLPDFAALHKKAFDKMESLSECQERKAQRARQMLKFTATSSLDGRVSQKGNDKAEKITKPNDKASLGVTEKPTLRNKAKTLTKEKHETKLNGDGQTYNRFGFKILSDVNPFSIPPKKEKNPLDIPTLVKSTRNTAKNKLNVTMSHIPKSNGNIKLNGTRIERSKSILTRDISTTTVVQKKKVENRDIIKGVRTNRRFELQMKARNMNN